MKKINILLLFVATLIFSLSSFGQGQLEIMKSMGEGSIFIRYSGKAGNLAKASQRGLNELKFEKNEIDKVSAFVLNSPGKDDYYVGDGFGWLKPNHHTQPSVFHSIDHKKAYVFIDGILYKLENVKDPNNITTFLLETFYILKKPSTGTHKSRKELVKEIKTRDHVAAIRTYLAEMKEVQEKATANFTDEEKNEIAIIEQAKIDKDNGIKAKNAAYWNSPEGKAVLAKGNKNSTNKMTVKNTGKKEVVLYADKGTIRISGGASQTFTCGDKVYHCSQGTGGTWNVKGAIVADGTKNCGKTIVVNND